MSQKYLDQKASRLLLSGRVPMSALIQTLAVAEHLNFRHATTELEICQSSVSTRVKTLEEDLGVLLFEGAALRGASTAHSDSIG